MKIEWVCGRDADLRLADEAFRREWMAFREQCPWGTAFQSHAFAAAWYQVYRKQYDPLLVLGRHERGELIGILPLAISAKTGGLIPAGGHQAEYQGWICLASAAEIFPVEALMAVGQRFPSAQVAFRYLPAGIPLDWTAGGGMNRKCLLKSFRRPLMQLGNGEEVRQSLKKSGNRNRLRQLKKFGPVEFQHLTDPAEFEAVLDQAALCHDCRQLAIHGIAPFFEDDLKRAFHLAMMNAPGLLHVTVLKVGQQIASFHLNVTRGKELQLYLIAHDPRFSRYSPGKLHVLFLARMLQEQGFERIDLTPGGDEYKERFANDGDQVQRLRVYPSSARRLKGVVSDHLEDAARRMLARVNLTPADIRCAAEEYGVRRLAALAAAESGRWRRWLRSTQTQRVYSCDSDAGTPISDRVRRDDLQHLLAIEPAPGEPSRRAFLSSAMRRLEDGQHIYTHAGNDRVSALGWLNEEPDAEPSAKVIPGFDVPADSAVILDFKCPANDPEQAIAATALRTMLHDAGERGKRRVYIAVPDQVARMHDVLEQVGFARQGSIVRQARMGREALRVENVSKHSTPPASDSPAAELPKVDFKPVEPELEPTCRKTG